MAKAKALKLKTKPTARNVDTFLASLSDERRTECEALVKLMSKATGEKPKLWGTSIVGFGSYKYTNTAGEGEWFVTGFSPRKQNLTVYLMTGFDDVADLMKKLGPHSTGKSCLYFKRLDDVSLPVLRKLVENSYKTLTRPKR